MESVWKAVIVFKDGARDVWEYLTQAQAEAVLASYKFNREVAMSATVEMV